jgi:hypothetical protein
LIEILLLGVTPLTSSVAPEATDTEAVPKAELLLTNNMPLLMLKLPELELAPDKVKVSVPIMFIVPEPDMVPANVVVVALLLPMLSDPPPSDTAVDEEPVNEYRVFVVPFILRAAEFDKVTGLLALIALFMPKINVPDVTWVAPV